MALVRNGKLAVAQRVPQLDGAIARAGDDLTVVGGEGDGEDIVGVADETAGGHAGSEFPKAEGLIPRGGECVGAVRGDDLEPSRVSATIFIQRNAGGKGGAYAVRDDVGVAV